MPSDDSSGQGSILAKTQNLDQDPPTQKGPDRKERQEEEKAGRNKEPPNPHFSSFFESFFHNGKSVHENKANNKISLHKILSLSGLKEEPILADNGIIF